MNKSNHPVLLELKKVAVNIGGSAVLGPINLVMQQQQQWAVIGNSGSGKTTLANLLAGKIFHSGSVDYFFNDSKNIELIEQQHHFKNLSNTSNFYYQQRFNASDAEDSIAVKDALQFVDETEDWIVLLHLEQLLEKPLLQLSNGENKRLQLAKALFKKPALLILDNPFIGLDVDGRKILQKILEDISQKGIYIILITSPAELPVCITHVAVLEKGKLISAQTKEEYFKQNVVVKENHHRLNKELLHHLHQPEENNFSVAVRMKDVSIRYDNKIILDKVNWEVKQGDCWSLSGPNGAGKSTLLSLITADNPQAYANDIILFDKQRGGNGSIWDIKRKIGFVSPELHLYFDQQASCFDIIASGLFDTIGLFRSVSADQEVKVLLWMRLMELDSIKNKRFFQLSTSQQRMALLARALVKSPPLLILDEPTQGLDEMQAAYFKDLVNEICNSFNSTLIYVSHYAKDIPSCVNHFIKLKDGKIVSD